MLAPVATKLPRAGAASRHVAPPRREKVESAAPRLNLGARRVASHLRATTMLALSSATPLLLAHVLAPCSRTMPRVAPSGPVMSSVGRNRNLGKLQAGYLFPEIGRRRNAYLEKNPGAEIISLGIGDTTQEIPSHILGGLSDGVKVLGTKDGYAGYGPEQGVGPLREKISEVLYDGKVDPSEVFVSDGSKCDIGRLQMMFGSGVSSAVQAPRPPRTSRRPTRHCVAPNAPRRTEPPRPTRQDPSYPVYVDTSVIMGQTGDMNSASQQYGKIVYMPCNPSNGARRRDRAEIAPRSRPDRAATARA